MTADEIAAETIKTICTYGRVVTDADKKKIVPLFEKGDELCVLVNNLGGTSNFEMSILANAAVSELENNYSVNVTRLLVGSYMTSFDMHGASISILNLSKASDQLITYLDSTCDAPAWIKCDSSTGSTRASTEEFPEIQVDESKGEVKLPNASFYFKAEVTFPPSIIDSFLSFSKIEG